MSLMAEHCGTTCSGRGFAATASLMRSSRLRAFAKYRLPSTRRLSSRGADAHVVSQHMAKVLGARHQADRRDVRSDGGSWSSTLSASAHGRDAVSSTRQLTV